MLLAALGERRPTRDIDLQASTTGGDTGTVLTAVCQIAMLAGTTVLLATTGTADRGRRESAIQVIEDQINKIKI
jgi:N-acetylglucosamine-6-phosphate deacetylase